MVVGRELRFEKISLSQEMHLSVEHTPLCGSTFHWEGRKELYILCIKSCCSILNCLWHKQVILVKRIGFFSDASRRTSMGPVSIWFDLGTATKDRDSGTGQPKRVGNLSCACVFFNQIWLNNINTVLDCSSIMHISHGVVSAAGKQPLLNFMIFTYSSYRRQCAPPPPRAINHGLYCTKCVSCTLNTHRGELVNAVCTAAHRLVKIPYTVHTQKTA